MVICACLCVFPNLRLVLAKYASFVMVSAETLYLSICFFFTLSYCLSLPTWWKNEEYVPVRCFWKPIGYYIVMKIVLQAYPTICLRSFLLRDHVIFHRRRTTVGSYSTHREERLQAKLVDEHSLLVQLRQCWTCGTYLTTHCTLNGKKRLERLVSIILSPPNRLCRILSKIAMLATCYQINFKSGIVPAVVCGKTN